MRCTINDSIKKLLFKGKSIDVIIRYIKMKYNITIDAQAIANRMQGMQHGYNFAH